MFGFWGGGGGNCDLLLFTVSYLSVLSWHTKMSERYIKEGEECTISIKINNWTFETERKQILGGVKCFFGLQNSLENFVLQIPHCECFLFELLILAFCTNVFTISYLKAQKHLFEKEIQQKQNYSFKKNQILHLFCNFLVLCVYVCSLIIVKCAIFMDI